MKISESLKDHSERRAGVPSDVKAALKKAEAALNGALQELNNVSDVVGGYKGYDATLARGFLGTVRDPIREAIKRLKSSTKLQKHLSRLS